jgi:hypothetical protein
MAADGDLVAVQQWSGLGTEANSIHPHVGLSPGGADDGQARLSCLDHGMARLNSLSSEHHAVIRCRPYSCLTGSNGIPLAAEFKVDHRLIPRRKSRRRNVSAGL